MNPKKLQFGYKQNHEVTANENSNDFVSVRRKLLREPIKYSWNCISLRYDTKFCYINNYIAKGLFFIPKSFLSSISKTLQGDVGQ